MEGIQNFWFPSHYLTYMTRTCRFYQMKLKKLHFFYDLDASDFPQVISVVLALNLRMYYAFFNFESKLHFVKILLRQIGIENIAGII